MIEASRGCGYRKVGGLYICGGGGKPRHCDRLPYPLDLCPVCGSGVKFTRGWTWLDWYMYAGEHSAEQGGVPSNIGGGVFSECNCIPVCPVCHPAIHTPLLKEDKKVYGLLWVGEASYTTESFCREAEVMGVSRRIPTVPRGLKLGKTVVLLAHKDAIAEDEPGVFEAFIPETLELLIWESEATEEKIAELKKRNITAIVIPDGDEDHDPDTKKSTSESETTRKLSELRNRLRSGG